MSGLTLSDSFISKYQIDLIAERSAHQSPAGSHQSRREIANGNFLMGMRLRCTKMFEIIYSFLR
jgi:hypothetical protein